jgi:hypothetical protein
LEFNNLTSGHVVSASIRFIEGAGKSSFDSLIELGTCHPYIYLNNLLWPVGGKNGAMCMVKRLALKRAIATNTAFTSSQQDIKS